MTVTRQGPAQDTPEQAAIRAKRGWLCNWTGGHCPRGCASPCTYKVDSTHLGGSVEVQDYNLPEADPIDDELAAQRLADQP